MANLDLSAIENKIDLTNTLLTSLITAVKAIPSTPGGGTIPPTPVPPPPTQVGWEVQGHNFTLNGVKKYVKIVSVRAAAFTIENNEPHKLNYLTGSAHQDDLLKTINTADTCGIDVIRFYGAISTYPDGRKGTDTAYCIRRSKEVLDYLHGKGMKGLIVLDENATSELHVYDGMHDGQNGRPTSWYEDGYKQVYLPFVEDMVHALSDHPAYWGCSLGNEYHLREQTTKGAGAVYNFLIAMGKRVKELNRGKFCFVDNETLWQLFAGVSSFTEDFVRTAAQEKIFTGLTLHIYNPSTDEPLGRNTRLGDAPNRAESVDITLAAKYNIPVLPTEMGVTRTLENPINAAPILGQWIVYQKSLGIAGGGWWLLADSVSDLDIGWHDDSSIDNAPNGHRYDWADMLKALAAI